MASFFAQEFYKEIKIFLKKIESFYQNNLISVVIFGSGGKGDITTSSDVDLFIVIKKSDLPFRKRITEFWEKVGDELNVKNFPLPVSPLIFTESEAKKFKPLYLDMLEGCLILYDKNNFIQKILKKVEKLLKENEIIRYQLKNKVYWRIGNEERLNQRLSF